MPGNKNSRGPLVSVIMPAYNHEKYVQVAIQSIIDQTYKNIELLVIDDGSKDSTLQKINELKDNCQKRFARVIFKTQQNMGTALTQNNLLDEAKGEYIYLLASDDKSVPCAIEKQLDFLIKNKKYGLCVGDNALMDSEGKTCYWDGDQNIIYDKEKAKWLTFGKALQEIRGFSFKSELFDSYAQLFKINHIPNGYLMRAEIFKNFRYSKEAPLEDWNLMLHVSKYYKMYYIDEILFYYRWHQNNSIKNTEKIQKLEAVTKDYEEKLIQNMSLRHLRMPVLKFILKKRAINKNPYILYLAFKLIKRPRLKSWCKLKE